MRHVRRITQADYHAAGRGLARDVAEGLRILEPPAPSIKWTKIKDPDDGMNEYTATVGGIKFYVYQSTDAGFGLTAYRISDHKQLHHGPGINWYRALKRCKAAAEKILAAEQTHTAPKSTLSE